MWLLNIGDWLIKVTTWTGLTVSIKECFTSVTVNSLLFPKQWKINWVRTVLKWQSRHKAGYKNIKEKKMVLKAFQKYRLAFKSSRLILTSKINHFQLTWTNAFCSFCLRLYQCFTQVVFNILHDFYFIHFFGSVRNPIWLPQQNLNIGL